MSKIKIKQTGFTLVRFQCPGQGGGFQTAHARRTDRDDTPAPALRLTYDINRGTGHIDQLFMHHMTVYVLLSNGLEGSSTNVQCDKSPVNSPQLQLVQ